MPVFAGIAAQLRAQPRRWLITGTAGFIGSHLLETLLALDQEVVGIDNFATGHERNIDDVRETMSPDRWNRFRLIRGDICDPECVRAAFAGAAVSCVLHQAALGSVPRSLADPLASHRANVSGFLQVLQGAREAGVRRVVYASSSSVYGDDPHLPRVEHQVGRPLSPYAATKLADEIYAGVFARSFGLETIGLRYFNVFGPRQNPAGPYAAVIPRWIGQMLRSEVVTVHGDGSTTRDFCPIDNVVQANILAATTTRPDAVDQVYNVATGSRATLEQVRLTLVKLFAEFRPGLPPSAVQHAAPRAGDVPHSLAAIDKAATLLGYQPTVDLATGLRRTVAWHVTRRHP